MSIPNTPEPVAPESALQPETSLSDAAELQKKLRTSRSINIVLAVLLCFVGGAYAAVMLQDREGGSAAQHVETQSADESQQGQVPDIIRADPGDYMSIGDINAPVTLIEWTDYTCPYCGVFHRETLPVILQEYVDTGKVRIEIHDVTYIGEQAEDAAVAARAAGLQDRYLDYMLAVYSLGENDNRPDLSRSVLTDLAAQIGLDIDSFNESLDDPLLRQEVQESTALAQSLGVSGVPFFVASIDGSIEDAQAMSGAQPLESFRQFLDAHVEAALSASS